MKEKYTMPEIAIEVFETEDIITVSGPTLQVADHAAASVQWNEAWNDMTIR